MRVKGRFTGAVALVTGAASGIGRQIATRLYHEGATLVLIDVDAATLKAVASEMGALGVAGRTQDTSIIHQIRASLAAEHIEHVDLLVNAAGISPKGCDGKRVPIWEIDPESWAHVMQINLNGYFHTFSAVLPGMIAAKKGSVVNISSLAGIRYSSIAGAAYATSKGAINTMTIQAAAEVAPFGIRVNAIAPGRIQTPMAMLAGDELNEKIRVETPLQRLGLPDDIASAALFLLSDDAAFITGQVITVSGGRGL